MQKKALLRLLPTAYATYNSTTKLLTVTDATKILSVTDHNRDTLEIDQTRIEDSKRMIDGTMRKYIVTDKRTFSTTWANVPGLSTQTVDKGLGATEMENFYLGTQTTDGSFWLLLTDGNQTGTNYSEFYRVMFNAFSKTFVRRAGATDLYNMSLGLDEA